MHLHLVSGLFLSQFSVRRFPRGRVQWLSCTPPTPSICFTADTVYALREAGRCLFFSETHWAEMFLRRQVFHFLSDCRRQWSATQLHGDARCLSSLSNLFEKTNILKPSTMKGVSLVSHQTLTDNCTLWLQRVGAGGSTVGRLKSKIEGPRWTN